MHPMHAPAGGASLDDPGASDDTLESAPVAGPGDPSSIDPWAAHATVAIVASASGTSLLMGLFMGGDDGTRSTRAAAHATVLEF
jgi:hypothetical protein